MISCLGDRAAASFGEHGEVRQDIHAGLVVRTRRAVAQQAHIAHPHPLDGARVVEQRFGSGEAGEQIDAQALGFGCEPGRELAQRDDIVAVVVDRRAGGHRLRHDFDEKIRNRLEGPRLGEHAKIVFARGNLHARVLRRPFGQQLSSGPGSITAPDKRMRTYRRGLFQHAYALLGVSCFRRIAQARPAGPPPTIATSYSMTSR